MIKTDDIPLSIRIRLEGPHPPSEFESDGCTRAPDYIGGADLRGAGHWHDYGYFLGGNEKDRERTDYEYYRNLQECGASRWLAGVEFRRVRFWGIEHFNYNLGSRPQAWALAWLRIRIFFQRYWRW